MVAVQNLKGEIIQHILSQKGAGDMYLVSATPTKLLIEFLMDGRTDGEGDSYKCIYPPNFVCRRYN
jgi:hypothetical protein